MTVTSNERVAAYRRVGIDPLDQNPDGGDWHLLNAIDDYLDLRDAVLNAEGRFVDVVWC